MGWKGGSKGVLLAVSLKHFLFCLLFLSWILFFVFVYASAIFFPSDFSSCLFLPLVDLCHVIADSGEVGGAGDGKPSALHPPGVPEADAHHQVLPCHQRLSAHHHQGVAGGVVAAGPISGSVLDAASGHSSVVDELLVCKCQPTPTRGLCGL